MSGTFTYDDALSTPKDVVRFLIADTDQDDKMVSDEGIATMLTTFGADPYQTAAALAEGLATKFARIPTMTVDGISTTGADRAEQFRILAQELRRQASLNVPGALGVPVVTGVSKTEEDVVRSNTDRDPNRFSIGQDDFPGVGISRPPSPVDTPTQ